MKGFRTNFALLMLYSGVFILTYHKIPTDLSISRDYIQLWLSRLLLFTILAHGTILVTLYWSHFRQILAEYFGTAESAYNLALFRVLFFLPLVGHYSSYCYYKLSPWAALPPEDRVSLPLIGWLVQNIPIDPQIYSSACIASAFFSLLVMLGLFTRFSLFMLVPLTFYVMGVPTFFGKMNHNQILLWVPLLLMFSPCAEVWSLDNVIKGKQNNSSNAKPVFDIRYGLPLKFLWILMAIIYGSAGAYKLWDCGLDWALGPNMVNQMRLEWVEHYDKVPRFRLDLHPNLAKISGLLTIYFELFYPILIFKPNLRLVAALGAYSLHRLAGYFMYIDFVWLRRVHFSYVDWHRIVKKVRWIPRYKNSSMLQRDNQICRIRSKEFYPILSVAFLLISFNLLFSLAKINSWPFSSYPTYSGLVKNEIILLELKAFDGLGNEVDVKEKGAAFGFRWENIRPIELDLVASIQQDSGMDVQQKMKQYWNLWLLNVPDLKQVKKIEFFLIKTSLVPEERHIILERSYIGELIPINTAN